MRALGDVVLDRGCRRLRDGSRTRHRYGQGLRREL